MPEGGEGEAGPLCWELGRLGQAASVRSCPAAFGLLFWRGVYPRAPPAACLRGA